MDQPKSMSNYSQTICHDLWRIPNNRFYIYIYISHHYISQFQFNIFIPSLKMSYPCSSMSKTGGAIPIVRVIQGTSTRLNITELFSPHDTQVFTYTYTTLYTYLGTLMLSCHMKSKSGHYGIKDLHDDMVTNNAWTCNGDIIVWSISIHMSKMQVGAWEGCQLILYLISIKHSISHDCFGK